MHIFNSRSVLLVAQSLLVLLLATTSYAALAEKTYRVRGSIVANEILSNVSELSTRAHIVVNGGEYKGFIQKDGSFAVDNVKLGDSLLEVASADYVFPKIHVRISLKEDGRASVAARYVQIGSDWPEEIPVLAYPLRFGAGAKYDFFTVRQGFSIITMFSNPYMMMVGASLVAVFLLPKLQAAMDPELLDEQNKKK
ncbi:hypothetical protein BX661DRAFT_175698 [Kickxella alabastrina]|uniref:uncharacterized protein n=1 Tax=Kickxella alabastrina TaxID=61397 RepID=UPI0022200853|nr:uncharacterized protein BX661DRAFT_175698 [Kickxella alabastrina]KAI7834876.1 hypothetical protein BX661DRAFT_175698 [Kickxella alabastrina]